MELLPETPEQPDVMTIANGPDTVTVECGHWYSPAAVKKFVELARNKIDDPVMARQAVRTLAAIDEALGIGGDGCGDPEQTLEAIADLKATAQRGEALALTVMGDQTAHDHNVTALRIKSEEHKCCAEDLIELRAAANALLHQIDIGDFTDSNGHAAKMLKATHDLMRVLGV